MSIKIIGAGLPRTGTNTLKKSLEILGYEKTYHMKELFKNSHQLDLWLQLEKTGTTDWESLYSGYQATVDFPAYPWYREHLKQYPDSKVILTVRPFEKWYASIESTIWKAGPQTLPEKLGMLLKLALSPRLRKLIQCVKFAKRLIFQVHLEGRFSDKAFSREVFDRHIEEVKAHVPAGQLLIYDVSEGWGPLCEFLGLEKPEVDLPHLNKRENFKSMLKAILRGEDA